MANVAVIANRSNENYGVKLRSRSNFGQELKTFIKKNPIPQSVLVQQNAKAITKKNGQVKVSPPRATTSTRAPMGSMASPVPVVARKRWQDVRDSQALKPTFLSAVNLISRPTAERIISRKKSIPKSLHQKLSIRKTQAASYFRNNAVPLSSDLGKKVVIGAGFGKCTHPKDEVARYEKYCAGGRRVVQNSKQETWPMVNARKFKKATPYVHKFTFNKSQKIERLNEIVLGLNKKSCDLYNKCKDFEIRVHRMTDEEIATAMAGVPPPGQSDFEGDKQKTRWIASEPMPGPSSVIEILATPAVRVYDIALNPLMKPFLEKAARQRFSDSSN